MLAELLRQTIEQWLQHPLLLLGIGAGITGYLVPKLTNRWQDHKKKLELKVGLIQRTTKLLSDMYTGAAFAPPYTTQSDAESLKKLFTSWYLEANVLRSELQAYFQDKTLRKEFDDLANAIMAWYYVNAAFQSLDPKEPKVQKVLKENISVLQERLNPKNFDSSKLSMNQDDEIWNRLGDHFRARMDALIEMLIDTKFKGF